MPTPRRPDAHGRARRRKEVHGLACLRALAVGPLVAAQMTPEGRLWCTRSGLAARVGTLWRITEKGRAMLRRHAETRVRFSAKAAFPRKLGAQR